MKAPITTWSYNEFLAFLLLYAASSDLSITAEEQQRLAQETGYDAYKKVLPVFEEQSDYERLQTILYFKPKYFSTPESAEKIIQEVQSMYEADNQYSAMEHNIFLLLRKVLL